MLRPSFFAEEATRELEPFVEQFGAPVRDASDPSHVSYSTAAFLKGWELGNREACGTYRGESSAESADHGAQPAPVGLALELRAERTAAARGRGIFVPRVWFVRVADIVATAVIWPDGTPIRAPQVWTT